MMHLEIKIARVGEPPLFPNSAKAGDAQWISFGILEKGTAKGNTSVAMVVRTADGKEYLVQTSAALFLAAASAV